MRKTKWRLKNLALYVALALCTVPKREAASSINRQNIACYETDKNEQHLVLECPACEDLRRMYIRRLMTNTYEFDVKVLLSLEEPKAVRAVATYLYYAFKRRK